MGIHYVLSLFIERFLIVSNEKPKYFQGTVHVIN